MTHCFHMFFRQVNNAIYIQFIKVIIFLLNNTYLISLIIMSATQGIARLKIETLGYIGATLTN